MIIRRWFLLTALLAVGLGTVMLVRGSDKVGGALTPTSITTTVEEEQEEEELGHGQNGGMNIKSAMDHTVIRSGSETTDENRDDDDKSPPEGGQRPATAKGGKDQDDLVQHSFAVPGEKEYAEGAPMGRSVNRSWPASSVMPVEAVREYFKDTLLIIMMSPPRYHLVNEVKKHYEQFFQHIFFCGPRNNSDFGVDIRGYDIVYGNEQYRAVNRILREHYMTPSEISTSGKVRGKLEGKGDSPGAEGTNWKVFIGSSKMYFPVRHNTPDKTSISGMLYVSDDVIMTPWSLAARGLNRKIPWGPQLGIGNTAVSSFVNAVPGMSVQGKFRARWNYWKKNRPKMYAAIAEAGDLYKYRLALAAAATHPRIFKWSKYKAQPVSDEQDAKDRAKWKSSRPYIPRYRQLQWSSFFTIVDTYYVPRTMWADYCDASDLMAKYWVFGELAIGTTLKFLHPVTEEMGIQFYWSTLSAADCHRYRWDLIQSDGIHRCRHDHKFVQYIFSNDTSRNAILADRNGERKFALTVEGLVPVPFEPLKNISR